MTAQLPSKERLSDDLLGQIAFYAGEAICHPDPNYALEYQKLAYPANVLALVNEVIASRALLAAHEQEPVADVVAWSHPQHPQQTCNIRWRRFDVAPGPLYTHPAPVPSVPDEMTIRDACKFVQDMRIFDDVAVIVMRTWNACRAAMLNHPEQHLDMVDHSGDVNEKVAPPLQSGNSAQPVTVPAGYVLVPVEPTPEMLTASYVFAHIDNTADSWKAMLAAAPKV
ncbi:hypothetical protein [Enterobacter asburiae]|uniref:hypothetical protein n=1 Tax=Enterobacter asburiae TaxID=61645 RepID=UPI003CE6AC52